MSQQTVLESGQDYKELTSSAGDFRASLTALLENAERLVTSVIYGQNLGVSLASLSLDGSWVKMYGGYCQARMDGSLEEYSMTWPAWGTLLDGVVTEPAWLVPFTGGKEFSLFPTPLASDGIAWSRSNKTDVQYSISKTLKRGGTKRGIFYHAWMGFSPIQAAEFYETIMGFPKGWTDLNA